MAVLGLLEGIRQRAAARGMTLTGLARAAEMQPGNLRRMLMSTTASPRLGSVMRLLPPLHCQVDPAGAHTADKLVAFLDTERQRQGWTWEQLLAPIGLDIDKTSASLSRPDRMSLEVFTRLAEALHIDIELVDDPTSSMKYPGSTATAPHPAAAPTVPERSAPHEAETISAPHPKDELAAAQTAIVVLRAELTREAEVRARAEKQAALAGELLGTWIQAYTLKNQECQEALEQRRAAEEHAAQAQATRGVDDAVTQLAATNHAMALRDAAENERARLAERLLAVENELADRRKAQADDANYLTSLLAADRIPEAITFFARRVLGAPFEDADQAFDALEQRSGQMKAESVALTIPPCGPGACLPDFPANTPSDAVDDAARPSTSAFANLIAAIEDDTAEVKRHPLMRRHHRRADGQLRTTRASVPDGQSASRWEPPKK